MNQPYDPLNGRIDLFGLSIDNVTVETAAADLVAHARGKSQLTVAFVNAHCVNVATSHVAYLCAIKAADRLFADGVGMHLAARLAGHKLRGNVNGTDLFPAICAHAAHGGLKLAFLGARPGVVDRCAVQMEAQHPGLKVVWRHHGFFDAADEPALLASLSACDADLLFIAMGVPRQELWLDAHRASLRVPVRLSVGALFDFYSGDVPRAPPVMRALGLEWLFRLILEPRRMFTRYVVGNPRFVLRALVRRVRGAHRLRHQPLLPMHTRT